MKVIINIANKETAIKVIKKIKETRYVPFDIRIKNTHIKVVNNIIHETIIRNDSVYINSTTLWDIMQPIGGVGDHHYHGLSPEDVYFALYNLKSPVDVMRSYDGRLMIVVDANPLNNTNYAIIVEPRGNLKYQIELIVTRIITIYPYHKNKNKC